MALSAGPFCGPLIFGSAETDPVRFKRGFEEGRLKDKFALFEAIFSCKCPIPEEKKAACKIPVFISKKGPVLKPLETGPDQFIHS